MTPARQHTLKYTIVAYIPPYHLLTNSTLTGLKTFLTIGKQSLVLKN